jgi:hypothetical protein
MDDEHSEKCWDDDDDYYCYYYNVHHPYHDAEDAEDIGADVELVVPSNLKAVPIEEE